MSIQEHSALEPITAKRSAKDSVFCDLFSRSEYLLQLYKALHPEASDIKESDLKIVTLESHLVNQQYNDLAFTVQDKTIVLMEAQSTWTVNIVLRMILYTADLWRKFMRTNDCNIYGTKPVSVPRPEFHVIYTGERKNHPETLTLTNDIFGGLSSDMEARITVHYGNGNHDILDQYVEFCRVLNKTVKIHGRTKTAALEIIRLCQEQNILADYLKQERTEVIDIMENLFNHEEAMQLYATEIEQNTLLGSIRNLMNKLHLSAEEAMTILEIPQQKQEDYAELLMKQ